MDASQDFKSTQEAIQSALVATTKTVNRIANEDLKFQRTINPSVDEHLDKAGARLLQLSGSLLKLAAKAGGQSVPGFEDAEDVDIAWTGIVDVIDTLLEKADTCLSEYTGLIKRKETPAFEDVSIRTTSRQPTSTSSAAPNIKQGPQPKKAKPTGKLDWSIRRANIDKPQDLFQYKTNNFNEEPWKPILTVKPHAKRSLEESLTMFTDENDESQYRHPYDQEILELKYPEATYEKRDPIPYLPVETTAATWVDTFDGVLAMLEELKKAKEIAVDLEHHDFRTYEGLLSLMQISTRERDWIVDTLKPWRQKLEVLNEVFTDPRIVKVFHGAQSDIVWLQRDLGLYIVGLFDTYFACEGLGYPGRGLAYLLKRFVDFDADKKYQMADWRIRPLPEEMFYYARSDTHYLLYIFDMVRNELVDHSDHSVPEKNLIEWALQKSKEVSLLRHESQGANHETGLGPRGWFNSLAKSSCPLNSQQFAVYRAVHKWRDDIARRLDESPFYMFTQQTLTDIARVMPTDKKALWSVLHNPAPVVKQSIDELFLIIQQARAEGVNGPTMIDFFRADTTGAVAKMVVAKGAEDRDKDIPSTDELKSSRSQLWGSVPLSSVWDSQSTRPVAMKGEQVSLPWTIFVQDAISQIPEPTISKNSKQPRPEEDQILLDDEKQAAMADEEFTLKKGRKRKSEELGRQIENNSGSASVVGADEGETGPIAGSKEQTGGETEEAAEKLSRAAKKAAKGAKKARKDAIQLAKQIAAAQKASTDVDGKTFDYSTAPSVLHAKKADDTEGQAEQKARIFDPYVEKTGAEIKGARRLNSEKKGKSATFKK